jgi:hypothetical protein
VVYTKLTVLGCSHQAVNGSCNDEALHLGAHAGEIDNYDLTVSPTAIRDVSPFRGATAAEQSAAAAAQAVELTS